MDLAPRHWLIALVGALSLHLSLLVFFERPSQPVGPLGGILIELGDGSDAAEGAPGREIPTSGAEDLPDDEAKEPEPTETEVVSETPAEEQDPVESEPPVEPVALSETAPAPKPEPVVAEPPAPPKPEKQKRTRSKKRKAKTPKDRRRKKIAKVTVDGAARGSGRGKDGKGSGRQGAATGSGASAAAAENRYAALISAWLNRNKRYPKRARRLGRQGSVTVRFTLDREGRVLSSHIVRGSGHEALDAEVRALMRRGPMPRMPAVMKQARMTITVPIRFLLQ